MALPLSQQNDKLLSSTAARNGETDNSCRRLEMEEALEGAGDEDEKKESTEPLSMVVLPTIVG